MKNQRKKQVLMLPYNIFLNNIRTLGFFPPFENTYRYPIQNTTAICPLSLSSIHLLIGGNGITLSLSLDWGGGGGGAPISGSFRPSPVT